jgi:hypothetical protein
MHPMVTFSLGATGATFPSTVPGTKYGTASIPAATPALFLRKFRRVICVFSAII